MAHCSGVLNSGNLGVRRNPSSFLFSSPAARIVSSLQEAWPTAPFSSFLCFCSCTARPCPFPLVMASSSTGPYRRPVRPHVRARGRRSVAGESSASPKKICRPSPLEPCPTTKTGRLSSLFMLFLISVSKFQTAHPRTGRHELGPTELSFSPCSFWPFAPSPSLFLFFLFLSSI